MNLDCTISSTDIAIQLAEEKLNAASVEPWLAGFFEEVKVYDAREVQCGWVCYWDSISWVNHLTKTGIGEWSLSIIGNYPVAMFTL